MPADELIKNRLVDIAFTLDGILTDGMGYTNDQRYRIAEELVRYLRLMLEEPSPAPSQAAASTPASGPEDEAEAAAKAKLELMAERDVVIRDNNASVRQRLGRRIRISDNNARVVDVICLEGGVVSDNNSRVEVYCPLGVTVETSDNNAEVRIRHRSYVKLLELALSYDL